MILQLEQVRSVGGELVRGDKVYSVVRVTVEGATRGGTERASIGIRGRARCSLIGAGTGIAASGGGGVRFSVEVEQGAYRRVWRPVYGRSGEWARWRYPLFSGGGGAGGIQTRVAMGER